MARGDSDSKSNDGDMAAALQVVVWRLYWLALVTAFALCASQVGGEALSLWLLGGHACVRWLARLRDSPYSHYGYDYLSEVKPSGLQAATW